MFLELVNRGSSGKLYTWQSNILLPYGSWYSPSLHLLDHDPQGAVKHSLDSRAICNMNFWCVLSREEFQERTVARVRSIRATNSESFYRVVHLTIQFVRSVTERMERKRRKGRNGKVGGEWLLNCYKSWRYFFQRRIICRDFELRTMSKHGCLLV